MHTNINTRKNKSQVIYQTLIFLSSVFICLFLFSPIAANAASESEKFPVPVSINALMVTLIDHSAHYIWDYGYLERKVSDEEWKAVEYYAIQLAAAGPLLTLGGSGALDQSWSSSEEWVAIAKDMSNAAVQALDAARYKNQAALLEAGNTLLDTCLSCHESFKPMAPTEGILHQPTYDHLYHLLEVN